MSLSIQLTLAGSRNGSVWVSEVNVTQCLQYFCLSVLVLAVTPRVVASHADRQALMNIVREEGGTRSMICAVEGKS